jgi:hypothetical protein
MASFDEERYEKAVELAKQTRTLSDKATKPIATTSTIQTTSSASFSSIATSSAKESQFTTLATVLKLLFCLFLVGLLLGYRMLGEASISKEDFERTPRARLAACGGGLIGCA